MSPELAAAIERLRDYKMSPREKFEQRVSFIYGMQSMDSPGMTKDEIRRQLIEFSGYPEEWATGRRGMSELVERLLEGVPTLPGYEPDRGPVFDTNRAARIMRSAAARIEALEAQLAQAREALREIEADPRELVLNVDTGESRVETMEEARKHDRRIARAALAAIDAKE